MKKVKGTTDGNMTKDVKEDGRPICAAGAVLPGLQLLLIGGLAPKAWATLPTVWFNPVEIHDLETLLARGCVALYRFKHPMSPPDRVRTVSTRTLPCWRQLQKAPRCPHAPNHLSL